MTPSPSDQLSHASALLEQPVDDRLFHLYEDDPNWSLCGRDLSRVPEGGPFPGEQICMVCADLDEVLP